jgi:GNAT superfamily N-acetyltransferase
MIVSLPSGLRLDIDDQPADADVEVLPDGLEAFNESRWPGHQKWRPIAVFARERKTIVAGLAGETYSGWLFIKYLWVSDALRRKGVGRELIGAAERRATSVAAIRPGSTPSASRRRASTRSSATSRLANSTIRRTSSGSFSGSSSDEARVHAAVIDPPGGGAISKPTATKSKREHNKIQARRNKIKMERNKIKMEY